MRVHFNIKRCVPILSALAFLACNQSPKEKSDLGVAELKVEGSPDAVENFNRGLLLLHSFEYEDARESFRAAIDADSSLTMAYWGEAMTFNHPIWHRQERDSALAILARLQEADAKPDSPLQADFIQSLEVLFAEEDEKEKRDDLYADFLGEMADEYPNNHEVQAFYALALLGSVEDGRDTEVYGKAGRIVADIIKENPKHPGALHYLIHAYDDPDHAALAMEAAHTYAKVAPSASHALHMPSHIFVAQGMWDEVISSNIDSYQASVDRMEGKGLDNDARGYHAYHWLQYGYLQKENLDKAAGMLDSLRTYVNETPSKRGRAHLIFLQGTYLVESEDWKSAYAEIDVNVSDLSLMVKAKKYFIEAMKAYTHNNIDSLRAAREGLEALIRRESLFADTSDFKLCIPSDQSTATPSDIASAKAILYEIHALGFMVENDPEKVEEYLKRATDLEDSVDYSFGPPSVQKPTHELYGDWLLSQKRYEDAISEYNQSLQRTPGRRLSVEGKREAESMLSDLALN
jgi:tetratricopeptide (TPR) repeat protein